MSSSPRSSAGPLGMIDGTMPEWQARVEANPVGDFVDYCLRGVGQVVFMNNPITGLLILIGIFVASAWLGVASVIGLLASTLVGILIGVDRGLIRAGLFGFNGILVGAGLGLFLAPEWDGLAIVWIIVVSGFSSILMATLATVFQTWGVPPFTLPFNFATLIFLVAGLQLANAQIGPLVGPAEVQSLGDNVETALRSVEGATSADDVEGWANAIIRGIGQLFFANDVVAGILIIAGIAVASRIAAVFALIGSAVGMLTGLALGASGIAIYNGLWGFNSFDACLAIGGVFYVLSVRSAILAVGCAVFTAMLFGALAALFTPWGLPALTLPFCFGTLAFTVMKYSSDKLAPVEPADITTPEGNLRRYRQERATPPEEISPAGPQARPVT
jgi:urea transporter